MALLDLAPERRASETLGFLWALLDDTTAMRRREIGDLPVDAIVWQPAPGSHSIGAVLLHMADAEQGWLHEVAGGTVRTQAQRDRVLADATDPFGGSWPTPPAMPLADLYAILDETRARSRELIGSIADPERAFVLGERSVTLRWVLKHVITHEAYHYGQVALLAHLWKTRG